MNRNEMFDMIHDFATGASDYLEGPCPFCGRGHIKTFLGGYFDEVGVEYDFDLGDWVITDTSRWRQEELEHHAKCDNEDCCFVCHNDACCFTGGEGEEISVGTFEELNRKEW